VPALQWKARYEQLRQQALEQRCGGRAWGLTLFLQRGLVAWMRACPQTPQTPAAEGRRETSRPEEPQQELCFCGPLHDALISVWVDMVLNQEQEACA
jgi:hypothetical protein